MEYLRNRKVAITGSNGFLGNSLVKELEKNNIEYVKVQRENFDLIDSREMDLFFRVIKPDVIFHLAADCGGIGYNVKNPADITYNNLMMSVNLFKNAVKYGNPKLIIIGSVDSYPANAKIPYTESEIWDGFPEITSGYYGLAKRMNLALGEAYYKQYGLKSIHPLLMNLYGPHDHFDAERGHVIPAIIKKIDQAISKGLPQIDIYGDGSTLREFIFVEDAAKLIMQSSKIEGFEYFNLGSGQVKKIIDVIHSIKDAFGFSGDINKDMSKPSGHPVKNFDLQKMKMLLGEFTFTPFDEGIDKTIRWYIDNIKID